MAINQRVVISPEILVSMQISVTFHILPVCTRQRNDCCHTGSILVQELLFFTVVPRYKEKKSLQDTKSSFSSSSSSSSSSVPDLLHKLLILFFNLGPYQSDAGHQGWTGLLIQPADPSINPHTNTPAPKSIVSIMDGYFEATAALRVDVNIGTSAPTWMHE